MPAASADLGESLLGGRKREVCREEKVRKDRWESSWESERPLGVRGCTSLCVLI